MLWRLVPGGARWEEGKADDIPVKISVPVKKTTSQSKSTLTPIFQEMAREAAARDGDLQPLVAAALLAAMIWHGEEPMVSDDRVAFAARRAVALLREISDEG